MIHLYFVGDGPRDAATLPCLVSNILEVEIKSTTNHSARLNKAGSGYHRKLQFAIAQAKLAGASGLVFVVDRDKAGAKSRLGELQEGRNADRTLRPSFPTALGEANPHGEAWLLDDPAAVRETLELSNDADIPNVRRIRSPKAALEQLMSESKFDYREYTQVLGRIASRVDHRRCAHGDETGFSHLVNDTSGEFGPLIPRV